MSKRRKVVYRITVAVDRYSQVHMMQHVIDGALR